MAGRGAVIPTPGRALVAWPAAARARNALVCIDPAPAHAPEAPWPPLLCALAVPPPVELARAVEEAGEAEEKAVLVACVLGVEGVGRGALG